jgi:hypothetical protein
VQPRAEKAVQPVEKLGVGDAVRVTVFQQPDLTLETRVDEKGSILMPLGRQHQGRGPHRPTPPRRRSPRR